MIDQKRLDFLLSEIENAEIMGFSQLFIAKDIRELLLLASLGLWAREWGIKALRNVSDNTDDFASVKIAISALPKEEV